MLDEVLELDVVDPRSTDAVTLVAALSQELAQRYDFVDDGSGLFRPEDALVPGSAFVVGRFAGLPVGCGAFRPLEPSVCEVKRMYVAAEFRGRGFSRVILAELERLASAAGYTVARLETGDRQPEAIALYERSGYRRIPNYGPYVGSRQSVCFERQLANRGGGK